MNKIKEIWTNWCEVGMKFPFAFDPTTKAPSITLLMLYFAALVMFSAEITNLFIGSIVIPTLVTVLVWLVAFVMYRLRGLDKVKFNLEEKSLELEDLPDEDQKGQEEK